MNVRPAQTSDERRVRPFLSRASWMFASYGDEDLPLYLSGNNGCCGWLSEEGHRIVSFLALSARRPVWADLRGLALAQTQTEVVKSLFETARCTLSAAGCAGMMCIATSSWLPRVLNAVGFVTAERIVTYERQLVDFIPASVPNDGCSVVETGGQALDDILAIDGAAFDAMWQMERREMLTHILTASHTTMAQRNGQAVGYAVTHVHDHEAQVIRLAVHPRYQGQGFGRSLLVDALHYCQVRGAHRVSLNTQESNDASQRLYRSTAFRPVGKPVPVLASHV